jgi:hypothetical protein
MGCWRFASLFAASVACEGSLPPPSARFGVQTPRRDAARCLDFRATAPVTAQSRPRQRALQGTRRSSEPTVRAVAFGHRLNAWVALRSFPRRASHRDTNCGGEPPSGAVAKCNARTPFLRRESRRCRCVGCQRRHVCVVWSRDLDVCNVDAPPPREGAETDRDGPLRVGRDAPRRLPSEATGPALALLLEAFGSPGCRPPTGTALNKCGCRACRSATGKRPASRDPSFGMDRALGDRLRCVSSVRRPCDAPRDFEATRV